MPSVQFSHLNTPLAIAHVGRLLLLNELDGCVTKERGFPY